MKKLTALLLSIFLIASLAACGNSGTATETAAPAEQTTAETAQSATEAAPVSADGIDVDLTTMSATMVYSEVQNMMMNPTDYLGKTVKMKGTFNVAELGDNIYYACLIKDATACCAQGIEFQWEGDHAYPEDYPEMGDEITVVGTFSTYKENTQTYCQLENSELTF